MTRRLVVIAATHQAGRHWINAQGWRHDHTVIVSHAADTRALLTAPLTPEDVVWVPGWEAGSEAASIKAIVDNELQAHRQEDLPALHWYESVENDAVVRTLAM